MSTAPRIFIALLLVALAAVSAWKTIASVRTDVYIDTFGVRNRRLEHPILFWLGVSVGGFLAVLLFSGALWIALFSGALWIASAL